MGNSSYINGDVEIMYDDSELRQTNHHVNPLFYLFCVLALPQLRGGRVGATEDWRWGGK
jgi:hypothetical protein